jgi:hypothetical protein
MIPGDQGGGGWGYQLVNTIGATGKAREVAHPQSFSVTAKNNPRYTSQLMRPTRHYWDTTSDYDTLDTGHRVRGLPAARTR